MSQQPAALVAEAAGILVPLVAFIYSVIKAGRKAREEQAGRLADARSRGEAEGKAARQGEVDLLRSERDDARRERDVFQRRADDLERELWSWRRDGRAH